MVSHEPQSYAPIERTAEEKSRTLAIKWDLLREFMDMKNSTGGASTLHPSEMTILSDWLSFHVYNPSKGLADKCIAAGLIIERRNRNTVLSTN